MKNPIRGALIFSFIITCTNCDNKSKLELHVSLHCQRAEENLEILLDELRPNAVRKDHEAQFDIAGYYWPLKEKAKFCVAVRGQNVPSHLRVEIGKLIDGTRHFRNRSKAEISKDEIVFISKTLDIFRQINRKPIID